MNIAFQITSAGRHSGISHYSKNLAYEYLKLGHKVNIWTTFRQKDTVLEQFIDYQHMFQDSFDNHLTVTNNLPHPFMLGKQLIRTVGTFSLRKFIKEAIQNDNIVHLVHPDFTFSSKYNVVITVHDLIPLYSDSWSNLPYEFIKEKSRILNLFKKCIENAALILTPSNFVKHEINEYFPKIDNSKIIVSHHSASKDLKKSSADNATLQKLGLLNIKYFLFVSSYSPRKNHIGLIEAYNSLPDNIKKDYKLVFVGSGNKFTKEKINNVIHNNSLQNSVIKLADLSNYELCQVYNAATCSVFPSFAEGFGVPPLESMQCECPVISSNLSSMPEIAGNAALLIDPYSRESIREGMIKIIEDSELRSRLIKNGIERAKNFSWAKTAKEHLEAYKKLV